MTILSLAMTAAGAFAAGVTLGAVCFSPRVVWHGPPADRGQGPPAGPPTLTVTAGPSVGAAIPPVHLVALDPATGHLTPVNLPAVPVAGFDRPHVERPAEIQGPNKGLDPFHSGRGIGE